LTHKLKRVAAGILPTLVLLGAAEIGLRVFGLDRPQLRSPLLTDGAEALHREDDELFFALKPDLDVEWQGVRVRTNHLGLRSPEVGPKATGEFRILSLGESTTFGAGVVGDATYSAVLEQQLRNLPGGAAVRVINAGTSAWSSFQSLKYLELHGLDLQPDLVLFYHEANDFLPSSVRAATGSDDYRDESRLALTDRQLYESTRLRIYRKLLSTSAIFRALDYYVARRKIDDADAASRAAAKLFAARLSQVQTPEGLRQLALPPRVTPAEREQNLEELLRICRQHGIRLVLIHPSYAFSKPHRCELTEFARREGVPLFDAFPSLHPGDGGGSPTLFLDAFHPTAAGHAALGRDLARFLVDEKLVPARPEPAAGGSAAPHPPDSL
jgi:lysophospholipase L1-like esterase